MHNVTWITPPYSAALKTAFGKEFLKLIDKNFPKNHHLHKILNRKTLKLSYSCTPNMYAIINAHNKKILMERPADENSRCSCQGANKANCPVPGECVRGKVVYHAAVKDKNGSTYTYTYFLYTYIFIYLRYNSIIYASCTDHRHTAFWWLVSWLFLCMHHGTIPDTFHTAP